MGREVTLHDNLPAENIWGEGCDEKTKIISEISARLLEFREISPKESIQFLHRLLEIWRISPKLFDLLLEILTGSRRELRPFSTQAQERFTSKQNEQQILKRELAKLAEKHPDLAECIRLATKK
jgi:hypothetical protein